MRQAELMWRLNNKIRNSGVTMTWLADQLGISRSALRRHLHDEEKLRIKDMIGIINALRLTKAEAAYVFFGTDFFDE